MTIKALVLAGGKGTRLKPLTDNMAKHLLPVANKPILFYIMEQIREAGIRDIGIVVSPENGKAINRALGDGSSWAARISYIRQSPPLGIAHAVKTAQDFLGDASFLLFLGDNLVQDGVKALVTEFNSHAPDALIVLKRVPDPRAFGVAEIDAAGKVIRVVEKPEKPGSDLALVGVYMFTPAVHQSIARIRPSRRGEYEITDAIQDLLETGKEVRSHVLEGWWLDTGRKEDLLEANRTLLGAYLKRDIRGEVDGKSLIAGAVEIGAGTKVENSRLQGPVSIAEGCRITDSSIGPFTSIGRRSVVKNSSIEASIVLENTHIVDVPAARDDIFTGRVKPKP
ncbi:MAG: glucose-1-phosphate thymidylyltransferase [Chloroflexi bacterium RBG_16_58_8]|nr:MAG: glucose-1-phosphate thymidylyltransferase [Chloroflexi bacterium RBG_16_58_8]